MLRYEELARRFPTERAGDRRTSWAPVGLSGGDVSVFLAQECARVSLGSAKGPVAEMRSLLRFLHVRGLTERGAAANMMFMLVSRRYERASAAETFSRPAKP